MTTPINTNRPKPPPPPRPVAPKAPAATNKAATPAAKVGAPAQAHGTATTQPNALERATNKITKTPGQVAKSTFDTAKGVKDAISKGKSQLESVKTNGLRATMQQNRDAARNPTVKTDKMGLLGNAAKVGNVINGAKQIGSQWAAAGKDIGKALSPNADQHDRAQAVNSTTTAFKTTLGTAKNAVELGRDAQKLGSTALEAGKAVAFKSVEGASLASKAGATLAAARSAVSNVDGASTAAKTAEASADAAKAAAKAAPAVGEAAAKAAGEAATKAALEAGGKTLAKAAGRLVPGVNIAIAAADAANAGATLADPKASTTKKVTSVITAIGSAAAATDVPVVAQAGAAVSAVSSFVGGLFG